jgi:hypothetical protein
VPFDQRNATICLDSVSEIAEVVLKTEKAKTKDPRKAYGELIDVMSSVIRRFRDLQGFNVYLSAKLEDTKDDSTGQITKGPSMPGKQLGPAMPYFFDEVFYLYVGKDQTTQQKYRALQTDADSQVQCVKDRSGMLEAIEFPDLGAIFNKILQG